MWHSMSAQQMSCIPRKSIFHKLKNAGMRDIHVNDIVERLMTAPRAKHHLMHFVPSDPVIPLNYFTTVLHKLLIKK